QFADREQGHDAQHLPYVDGSARRWRQQQRPQCLAVALALERATECQRSGKLDRDPQYACCGILERLSFLDEGDREHEHAREGEEQRRVENLSTLDLDREILAQDEQRGPDKHHALPTTRR